MNCQRAHKQIYLFTELTPEEQTDVLNHIHECESCKELDESMRLMNHVVSRVAKVRNDISDPFLLTHKIMSTIAAQERQSNDLFNWISRYIELRQVKLAMAGISVLLIFVFGIELNQPLQYASQHASQINRASKTSILNAREFQDQLNKYKSSERYSNMLGCKDPFKVSQYNVACLREKFVHFKTL